MSENEENYYVISYNSTEAGCPVSMAGFFNCQKFEWDPYESNPERLDIKHHYGLELTSLDLDFGSLDFDFYQVGAIYVSKKFLDVCDSVGAKYRAVPFDLKSGSKIRQGEFFIFLPGESLAAMDKERSIYEVSKDIESGLIINSPLYPGSVSIDKIDLFVVSESVKSDIFRCQETLELFCSERFLLAASDLKGISFGKVDSSYKYDPWAELDEL
ncbi:imm11 family protein [Pseudomonas putida]|uniref:Immunity MXAN-0049 protein domain-containing protein n=1 Tax=Pseudomonas putida TaxID=303 RepID=A0AAW6PQU1_PSEPU|nr:DUF1629 domain-containing protein [Pseudomonas putida]MDF3871045.1 hypothetical protein [Pseudomonas putida]MDF3876820.1 hypothetical protein [Pseudomonas putida]